MEAILLFIMIESIITPIITLIALIISLYMAKKFGGMYSKFFLIFSIGWIFQILHAIDETFLVQALPSIMPPEAMTMNFPEALSKYGNIPSPLFMMLGIPTSFLLVKMAFMVLCAVIITYALYIHYKIATGK